MGQVKCMFARMRIGAVLHPTVLFAFSNCADLKQHGDCPSFQRSDCGARLVRCQHAELLRGRIPGTASWFLDRLSKELGFVQTDHILQAIVICWSLRHALQTEGLGRPDGKAPTGRVRPGNFFPAPRASSSQSQGFSKIVSERGLHERGGAVARTSGWLDRIYYAPAADRGLMATRIARQDRQKESFLIPKVILATFPAGNFPQLASTDEDQSHRLGRSFLDP